MFPAIERHVRRWAEPFVELLLAEEPALLLEGPRGSGKSTLLRAVAQRHKAVLIDLDDDAVLQLVREDPISALSADGLVAIDEFHRAPEVLSVVKRVVDRQGGVGRFLLAGSVSSFLLPPGTETLTGRAHRLALMPLSAAEALGSPSRWIEDVLAHGEPSPVRVAATRADAFDAVVAGGYPAALVRPTINQRSRWFSSYLSTVTDRDVPELVDTRRPGVLSRLYRIVSQRTSSVIVNTEVAPTLDVTPATVASYREILARLYLTTELPGWSVGVSAKPSHRPKVHVTDTGLATGVLSLSARQLATSPHGGAFVESFVLNEVMRQAASIDEPLTFAHFRDRSGVEVDIIIERHDGRAIGVEVKSAVTVQRKDAAGLLFIRDRLGDRFQCGIVFHSGSVTARLDDRIWAVPLSSLWGGRSFAQAT